MVARQSVIDSERHNITQLSRSNSVTKSTLCHTVTHRRDNHFTGQDQLNTLAQIVVIVIVVVVVVVVVIVVVVVVANLGLSIENQQ